jgi:cell filamentation protein
MKKGRRYDTSGIAEAEFEPGSGRRVLKNLIGVKRKREMDQIEARELLRAHEEIVAYYDRDHQFSSHDICRMHKIWLGPIYPWAGQYRKVNLTRDNFTFAAATQIPTLMRDLEEGPLSTYTPCVFKSTDDIVTAISTVHVELVLVHPFREGNGRLARLVATLMALQGGLPPLDFGGIRGQVKQEYFLAVRTGLDRDYRPMEKIISAVISRTQRQYS